MRVMDTCPVCRKCVYLTSVERIVLHHLDTIGYRCPMSGNRSPITIWEASA